MPRVHVRKDELAGPKIEDGDYPARIDIAKMRKSAKNNDVLFVGWKIIGDQPPAGASVPDNFTLIPEAYWKLNILFRALSFEPDEDGFDSEDLVNKECIITVANEDGDQGPRVNVKSYKPL